MKLFGKVIAVAFVLLCIGLFLFIFEFVFYFRNSIDWADKLMSECKPYSAWHQLEKTMTELDGSSGLFGELNDIEKRIEVLKSWDHLWNRWECKDAKLEEIDCEKKMPAPSELRVYLEEKIIGKVSYYDFYFKAMFYSGKINVFQSDATCDFGNAEIER